MVSVAKALGISWQQFQSWNKGALPSPSTPMKIGAAYYTVAPPNYGKPAAQTDAQKAVGALPIGPTEAFNKVLPWETFLPSNEIRDFTNSQVNPQFDRELRGNQLAFDYQSAINNAFRTGKRNLGQQTIQNQNSAARKGAYADLFGQQEQLFTDAWKREMDKYGKNAATYIAPKTIGQYPSFEAYRDAIEKGFV